MLVCYFNRQFLASCEASAYSCFMAIHASALELLGNV
jgi:hypothetical protein